MASIVAGASGVLDTSMSSGIHDINVTSEVPGIGLASSRSGRFCQSYELEYEEDRKECCSGKLTGL